MRKLILTTAILLLLSATVYPQQQKIAGFTVLAGEFDRYDTPVSVCINRLNYNTDAGSLHLYETTANKRVEIPCQVEPGHSASFWWILSGETKAGQKREFVLEKGGNVSFDNAVETEMDPKRLILKINNEKVLQYNHAVVSPPEGVDPIYRRSGFIHPLWSPHGNEMTRISPPDHYHHVGIWSPWTKTKFHGHETDFWNLIKGQGTVKFAGFSSFVSGPVFGGFKVKQEHIDFQCKGPDQVALNEEWDVRAWNIPTPEKGEVWLWDLTTTLNCASDSSILMEKYRYGGGIGFRANEDWTNKTCKVLTSEGKTRKNADGTRARWCDINGEFSNGKESGIVFLSHPSNREHPEPMRVWPEKANRGRGDMFFEFCPIRLNSWKLNPGNDYVLKYRMLVYDGKIDTKTAEAIWNDFSNPPMVIMSIK